MNRLAPLLALLLIALVGCVAAGPRYCPAGLPVYDHVVIVVEENKDYEQIVGNPAAPYLNRLAAEGALLTQMFGEEHNSEGNYFWLFSGDNQGVGFDDKIPSAKYTSNNLGAALIAKGLSFKAYSEGLPAIGSEIGVTPSGCHYPCHYGRQHASPRGAKPYRDDHRRRAYQAGISRTPDGQPRHAIAHVGSHVRTIALGASAASRGARRHQ